MERWSEDSPNYRSKHLEEILFPQQSHSLDTKQSLLPKKAPAENSLTNQWANPRNKKKKEAPRNIQHLKRKLQKEAKVPGNQIKGTNIIVDSHFPDFPKPQPNFNSLFQQLINEDRKKVKTQQFPLLVSRTITNMKYQIVIGVNCDANKPTRLLYKIENNPLIEIPLLEQSRKYQVQTEGNFILRATNPE